MCTNAGVVHCFYVVPKKTGSQSEFGKPLMRSLLYSAYIKSVHSKVKPSCYVRPQGKLSTNAYKKILRRIISTALSYRDQLDAYNNLWNLSSHERSFGLSKKWDGGYLEWYSSLDALAAFNGNIRNTFRAVVGINLLRTESTVATIVTMTWRGGAGDLCN